MYTGILNYKKSRNKNTLYLIISFALLAIMMYSISLAPLLIDGQDFLAEITIGGAFILAMIVIKIINIVINAQIYKGLRGKRNL